VTGAVCVSSLTGSAERTGELHVGDTIAIINGRAIKTMQDVTEVRARVCVRTAQVMKVAPATAPLTVVVQRAARAASVKHTVDIVLECATVTRLQ